MGVPWWPNSQVFGIVTAVPQLRSLAQKLPYAMGLAEKKKVKTTYKRKHLQIICDKGLVLKIYKELL